MCYSIVSIFTGIFEFLADLCLCLGAWKASVMLHNYMATNVFRNPMKFFDATPTGRILSRFSSDVEVVDKLSQQISDTVYCFMDVRAILLCIHFFFLASNTFDPDRFVNYAGYISVNIIDKNFLR